MLIPYFKIMRESKDPKYLRFEIVRYAEQHGVKPAARAFGTTPKTIRKWLRRWQPGTLTGLDDLSRAPKNSATAITVEQRQRVIELKRQLPTWGAQRLKRDFDLALSDKAIRRIWHQENLLKRQRRKPRTKQDLRAIKAQWRLFEQTCLDTKDLIDIPELWPQLQRLQLPKVQYTAREVVSGLQFLAYADERALIYSALFAEILIAHLQRCGVSLQDCRFQTDNGSEFIGAWNAREDSAFTKTIQAVKGLVHHTIPPAAHTWQADVETVHGLIEDEFYCVEAFHSRAHFLDKAAAYNLWFNVARKNSSKRHKTPWEIVMERKTKIHPAVATWKPVYLDELWKTNLDAEPKGGYDVIPQPCFIGLMGHWVAETPRVFASPPAALCQRQYFYVLS